MIAALFLIWAAAAGLNSTSSAPQVSTTYSNAFDAWVAKHRPTRTIAVVREHGHVVFRGGHGVDPDAPTMVSSLSKPITGVCIGTLIRDSRLAFTTPLRDALAEFFRRHGPPTDPRLEAITIEQLLTHRSGLIGIGDNEPIQAIWRRRAGERLAHVASPNPLLAEIIKYPLEYEPRHGSSYSNAAFIALTAAIEEATGQPYESYCQTAVFNALGIASARLHPDWRMFSGARGWMIRGADYLAFLDVFGPANPFLGDEVKRRIVAAKASPRSDADDTFDGLGIPTAIRPDGWHVVHSGVLLNFTGKRQDGRPIEANVHAHAYRETTRFSMFLATSPVVKGEVLGELDEALYRARAEGAPHRQP